MVVGTEQMAVPFRIYATPESSNNPTFPPDTDPSLCVSGDILRSRLVSANRERRMDAWVTGCARPLVAASEQAAEMSAESRTILVNGREMHYRLCIGLAKLGRSPVVLVHGQIGRATV